MLVVFVVFLFLQSLRLTIIPTIAVPVSIFGTFVGMLLLGYSINMLTLFGMILAIGIVVDDAIVVIENTERNMTEFGLSPKDAAKRAMTEVSGPVIAIVLVLCAVFIPVAFLGGITGQLYKQFAVTVAISVVFSGIVALTLSPALAALLLKPHHGEKNGFFKGFDAGFDKLTNGYVRGVVSFISTPELALRDLPCPRALARVCCSRPCPSAFVPQEDQGYMFVPYFLPDAASLDRTGAVGARAADFMQKHPAVANVTQINGYSLIDGQYKTNTGVLFVSLKDFEERQDRRLARPGADQGRGSRFQPDSGKASRCRSIRRRSPASASPPASKCGCSRKAAAITRNWSKRCRKSSPRPRNARNCAAYQPPPAPTAGSCWWMSTATRRKRWACRCRMSTTACRPCSARCT